MSFKKKHKKAIKYLTAAIAAENHVLTKRLLEVLLFRVKIADVRRKKKFLGQISRAIEIALSYTEFTHYNEHPWPHGLHAAVVYLNQTFLLCSGDKKLEEMAAKANEQLTANCNAFYVREAFSRHGKIVSAYKEGDFGAALLPYALDPIPDDHFPWPISELRKKLYYREIHVKSREEYEEIALIWCMLGGHIWTYHKGYSADPECSNTYRLGDTGFLREIHETPPSISLKTLRALVNVYLENSECGSDVSSEQEAIKIIEACEIA